MTYGKGTLSGSGYRDFDGSRHEIALTTGNFRLRLAQLSVWLAGALSSLCRWCQCVSPGSIRLIGADFIIIRSWVSGKPRLIGLRVSLFVCVCVCLGVHMCVCVHAHLLNVIGREPPKSSKDHCEFATSVTLMYRHTRSQRSRNLLDWNVVS